MIKTSDSIKAISKALFAFQGAVDGVEKNKTNPGFKSRYANMEAVRDTAVPELQNVGVVYVQSAGPIVDGNLAMTTRLIHVDSGEWIEGTMDIALGKKDPQGTGSASTYAARYSLMHMLGLPPIDDDAEGAMDRPKRPSVPPHDPTTGEIKEALRQSPKVDVIPFAATSPQPFLDRTAKAMTQAELKAIWEEANKFLDDDGMVMVDDAGKERWAALKKLTGTK